MNQDVRTTVEEETLAEVPEHVFNTLPDEVKLFPSAVNKARIGVWSTQRILKGRKFGPFVGEKKKRSQVKNNVYMWEVYYPNLGWMCIDATDPKKGSWLRYVNWARSAKEQNLCPLEIKRAIYYKTLKPIEPGEELLVWYNGEENPEIAAAIEEERAKHRIRRRHSPKAKKGRRKSLEGKKKANKNIGVRQRKADSGHSSADMRDSEEGIKEDDENPSLSAVLSLEQTALIQEMINQDALPKLMPPLPSYEPQIMAQEKTDSVTHEREKHKSESQKENSENEYLLEGLEKHEHLEESKSTSEETPESSPKKKVSARTPKIKTEPNGDLLDSFLFPCQHCERKFTTKQGLERHMHIHVSSFDHAFKCRYCGKAFGTQINRRRHERRHEAGPKRKLTPLASDDFADNGAALDEPSLKTTDEKNAPSLAHDYKISESEPFGQENPPYVKEEHMEARGFHPCRYCKKVFGTHINMRRHQRRVHERHLLPKGVRRKGLLEERQSPREQTQPSQSVYTTSTELDEEGETDDVYIMDVSNNISENLNYYIDGKIEPNGSTSNCEVIEVQSNPAEMYKLNCLITPVKIELSQSVLCSQTPTTENLKESSNSVQIESKKRRTTSPPLLTTLKTEIKAEPITPSCPLSLPLTVSVSDNLPFHKEKSVFLSSKLKQLLQTQDGSKLSPSLLTEVPKLVPTVSSPIPTVCSRFKRRTSTPPSSPQHSPGLRDFGKQVDGKPAWHEGLNTKIPKLESHSSSPVWSLSGRDERENISPLCNDEFKMAKDWTTNLSLSSSCNQQPLDLSSGVKQRSESKCSPGPWESVLDLSIHKKTCDLEVKEQENSLVHPSCGGIKKKKPTTCMLQKVLLNEYDGKDITLEDAPCLSSSPGSCQSGQQQPLSEKVSFSSSISVMSPSHILQISDSTLPLLIPTYVTSPLSFRTEFTIATRPLPSPAIIPSLAEPSNTTSVSSFTSLPPSPVIISSVPEPSNSTPVSSLTFPPLLPIPSSLPEPSNIIPILPCSPPPPSSTVLPSLPDLSNTTPVHSYSSLPSPLDVQSLLPEASNITHTLSSTPPPSPTVHSSVTKPSNVVPTRSCASPPPSAKVRSPLPKCSDLTPTHSCTSLLSNKSAHSPLPVLSPTESHSLSSVLTDYGSISSPGPPTLSSSSTSSSDSSDSSDSSSCSSSPPPLSVASFDASPLSKITPTVFIKQEVIEEQVTPKETLRVENEESPIKGTFSRNFVCNVCESPFPSINELTKHLSAHAEEWPFKCEFCVQLFKDTASLTEHRFLLHGVGKIFICSICKKEFAFMCNLQQHQQDLHPDKEYTHHEFESGTLRPQNFTDPSKADLSHIKCLPDPLCHDEDGELDDSSEELYTTIKIMASGEKSRDPDVRMGINQHYPSFKPPPFQYHNRNPLGIGATATNFTTHNIPQTFSTAIRCTKCGKSVDNLPELHKHILVCASASDKKRYTPKKNPIPLKHATPPKTGLPAMDSSEKNAFRRAGQPKKMLFNVENGRMSGSKLKMNALKKKNQLVHKAILQKKKSAKQKVDIKTNLSNSEPLTCPYCNRVFTYSGSLNKHAAYSCPKKPVSPVSKKNGSPPSKKSGKAVSSASNKKSSSKRRRTADAEIKMQSTETHLGKTRARSSEPPPIPSPPSPPPLSIKPKQNVKYVPSVKPNKQSSSPIKQSSPPIIRSSSPVRMLKITQLVELKKVKTGSLNNPSTSSSKTPGKLHVRVKKNTAILKRKSSLAHERSIERSNIKPKKKPSRPITRSLQYTTSTDAMENKKDDAIGKQELRDLRNLL